MRFFKTAAWRKLLLPAVLLAVPVIAIYGIAEGWNMGQWMVAWGLGGLGIFVAALLLVKVGK